MDNRITLRHLEAFRAVMVRKTVTAAADMLGITQPVVTRLLSDLEERIAITLFTRERGRLVPTAEAALLFNDVNQSLMGIERIANAASSIKALKLGHLEIAASPSMALTFLPHAIASFSQEHPNVLVSLHMHSSPTVLDMVQTNRCDLGFAHVPMRTTRHGNSEILVSTRKVSVVPVGHRLAGKSVLRPEDFEGESFVSYAPSMEARMRIDSLMLSYGVNRRIVVETAVSSVVVRLVETGMGVSIIDAMTASYYRGSLLSMIPFEDSIVDSHSLIISKRNASTLILKPFIDHVRREIRRTVPAKLLAQSPLAV
ncbi:LysR substrate-binding domain-containing protein [Simplicispira suum]|uniref:LysR family transcriptional regulator n=1 Tax=Simplicispira suum TaxID=2109915 RepID=A0A2S0N2J3_9BURK|nr:LysR substrate-binding domain-containing protein [Simplicispira suum]AVO42362.1 LysR family transcriptional regulator [Simplicispira suum]